LRLTPNNLSGRPIAKSIENFEYKERKTIIDDFNTGKIRE
jgi:hypothetical protein